MPMPMHVPELGAKIDLLLIRGRHLLTGGDGRATKGMLAGYLGIDERKLSTMIHGHLDKGIPPGRVPDDVLDDLSKLLARIISGNCKPEDARHFWLGDLLAFQIALGGGPKAELLATLAGCSDRLGISVYRRKKSSLRAVRAAEIIPADALEVASNQRVQFRIEARLDRRLMAVCREPQDIWRLIAPGRLHDGIVAASPTILPSGSLKWLPFDEPLGVHHFVFIEHDADLVDLVPAGLPDSRILSPGQVAELAGKLSNPALARKWRWGEKVINAVESR